MMAPPKLDRVGCALKQSTQQCCLPPARTMGSYISIMNDGPVNQFQVDVWVKFSTTPPMASTVLALAPGAPGVVAAIPSTNSSLGTDTVVIIDSDTASETFGLTPDATNPGNLLANIIGAASIDDGYSYIPRGDVLRSDRVDVSSKVFVQWHMVSVNNPQTVVLFGGVQSFLSGNTTNGDNRFLFLESFLAQSGVDTRLVNPILNNDTRAAALVAQYEAMIQSEDTSAFTVVKTASQPPCSLIGMQALD
ncbi:hypothetical protein MIND_00800800 [Mycena indigotica]|uniref:Uncharacterized protein n=1 Tax=Mycena indigotica TaxID=2126181 RepID=A0A8H6SH18_9AGAR|nr:uncharacterized protein MIND_00800800 [Mycena indigotica]KAF7298541.1 hypothetical protein MIND_00800800 [Mycena indigotica]